MQRLYGDVGLTLQPLVIKLRNEDSAVVALDKFRWPVESLLKAIDVCFKLIHVSMMV
jgi:hypothetical protein